MKFLVVVTPPSIYHDVLVVPAAAPIPENSQQSTNFPKLINLSSGFEVKQRRFFSVFNDTRDRGQWFWKGFGGNPFGMGE